MEPRFTSFLVADPEPAQPAGQVSQAWPGPSLPIRQILYPYSSSSGATAEQTSYQVPSCTAPSSTGVAVGCGSHYVAEEGGK